MNNIDGTHTNQRVLLDVLVQRGAQIFIENPDTELVRVVYRGQESYLLDRFNERVPYSWVVLTASKLFTKNLLFKNGISVPMGDKFNGYYSNDDLMRYATELQYPLVVKPDWGSHGDFVYSRIKDSTKLSESVREFVEHNGKKCPFIIEEYFPGSEHRIFMTELGEYAILKREPAYVIGNGKNAIDILVRDENERRVKIKKSDRTSQLCPIVIDEHVERRLADNDLNMRSVPHNDEKVYLRLTSNIAKGGVSHNLTDVAHQSVVDIAKQVANIVKLPFMGIDFITDDISKPQNYDSYRIIEVNSSPGFAMHLYPCNGKPVNVAEFAANVLFGKEK